MGNNFDKIPKELRELKQWCMWNKEVKDGKETKIPYQPEGKRQALLIAQRGLVSMRLRVTTANFQALGLYSQKTILTAL